MGLLQIIKGMGRGVILLHLSFIPFPGLSGGERGGTMPHLSLDRFEGGLAVIVGMEAGKFFIPSPLIEGEEGDEVILSPSLCLLLISPSSFRLKPIPTPFRTLPKMRGEVAERVRRLKEANNEPITNRGEYHGKGKGQRGPESDSIH